MAPFQNYNVCFLVSTAIKAMFASCLTTFAASKMFIVMDLMCCARLVATLYCCQVLLGPWCGSFGPAVIDVGAYSHQDHVCQLFGQFCCITNVHCGGCDVLCKSGGFLVRQARLPSLRRPRVAFF